MLAAAESNARVATVGRGLPTVPVRPDHILLGGPRLAVVAAPIENRRGLQAAREHHDVARLLVDGHVGQFAPADVLAPITSVVGHVRIDFGALADLDRCVPRLAAVRAAFQFDEPLFAAFLEDEHTPVHGDRQMAHHRHVLVPDFVQRRLTGDVFRQVSGDTLAKA